MTAYGLDGTIGLPDKKPRARADNHQSNRGLLPLKPLQIGFRKKHLAPLPADEDADSFQTVDFWGSLALRFTPWSAAARFRRSVTDRLYQPHAGPESRAEKKTALVPGREFSA